MNIELHAEIGPQRSPFNDPERHKGDQSADPAHFDARRARKLASKHRWQLPQTFSHDLGQFLPNRDDKAGQPRTAA